VTPSLTKFEQAAFLTVREDGGYAIGLFFSFGEMRDAHAII
jgi:hypothetical protein